jgi:hypothetical protein
MLCGGFLKKEDLNATLRANQAAIDDAAKSPQREEAEAAANRIVDRD